MSEFVNYKDLTRKEKMEYEIARQEIALIMQLRGMFPKRINYLGDILFSVLRVLKVI